MADWRNCKLGDLLQIKHGFAFLGEHFASAGTHVVLTPGNFLEEGGFKEKAEKAKWYNGPIPADYVLNKGDLIVAMTEQAEGLLGSSALIPRSGVYLHNQRLGLVQIRDQKQADQHFIYYLFNSKPVRQQIRGSASGTKIRHTAPSRIADVKVSVPSLHVQQRIAGILSAYDELIENSQRRIKILESMARALYREWFVHFRFPGHENHPRVASPLGEIPLGWEVKKLGEIAENFDRMRKPLSKMQRAQLQGEYPYFGAAKVFDYVNNYIFDGEYLLLAEDGSVITPERAPVLQLVKEKFWPNNHTHILRGKPPFSTHFLYLGLSEVDISPYITGAAQPKITQENMNRIPFFCGPEDMHLEFNRLVESMIRQSHILQRQVKNLRRTRDLLLPRLLSGQIDVEALSGGEADPPITNLY
ncbi:MAG: type I restriction enzyme S subunit [bacterium]|nr:MAG: type I restriction enzyme S subunit [bacterium]KAF0148358.1 MAG: type I restriction enzyme S subunit [bacterium]KAF0167819.1 MAG: type I restriction enzyme S subunit [bacterium]TXT18967.1 MAG: type I restriction enzyme S subunit [bacterium]